MKKLIAALAVVGAVALVTSEHVSAFDGAGGETAKAARVYMPTGKAQPQADRVQYRSFSFGPSGSYSHQARRTATVPREFRADRKIRN